MEIGMTSSIQIPTNCPECDSVLVKINDQLFCQNKSCPAQINKKIEHFTKTLGIKGFGEKTVEKLNLESISSLYQTTLETLTKVVGEKTATKLFNELERSKTSAFATVLSALSIPLIGNTASTKLATVVNGFDEITPEACVKAGLGEKASQNLLNWLQLEYPELGELPFKFENNNYNTKKAENYLGIVCISGKLKSYKNKAEAAKELEILGYKIVDTLTKAVTILIDEENRGSSKRKAAEERGIQIITDLKQFINN